MKKIIICIICVLFVGLIFLGLSNDMVKVFLTNSPKSAAENLTVNENDPVFITAHRGSHLTCPENSLPAFKNATQSGYYAAECDIIRTSDGKWVVAHDNNLLPHFKGKGKIEDMTFEEVRQRQYFLDKKSYLYKDEKIPSMEEYLDLFVNTAVKPQIEIKSKGTDKLEDVINAIAERNLTEKVIIISFDFDALERVHELEPKIEIWYLSSEITEDKIEKALSIGCTKLAVNYKKNDYEKVQLVFNAGLDVAIWTVDDIKSAQKYYDMGVRYMTSNTLCP